MGYRRRFALLALAALLTCCSVALCADNTPAPVPKLPVKDFTKATAYTVERIVDGDTVVLSIDGKSVKVRLVGVDTPETVHPNKPVQRYGREASRFLKNLLDGEKVYIEWKPDEKTDKYGRALLYLWRAPDGLFVNLEIVRQGYGHAYTKFPFKHMALFKHYEKKAREAKRGLWAPDAPKETKATAPAILPGVGKPKPPAQEEVTVYVTRTGRKYHRVGCRYLRRSSIPMKLSEAKARYGPCSVCKPPR